MNGLVALWGAIRRGLSWLVLVVLYFGVLTPIGLLARVVRADPLARTWEPERTSYWVDRETPVSLGLWSHFATPERLWLLPVVAILLGVGLMLVVSESGLIFAFLYPLF